MSETEQTSPGGEAPQAAAPELPRLLPAADAAAASIRALFSEERAPRLVKRKVVASLRQIRAAAAEAQAEAERVVALAREEADAIREQARQEGYEAGLAELVGELDRARREYDRLVREAELDMIELATRMAERIIHQRVQLDDTTARDLVLGCLERVRDRRQILVLVHPEDLAALERWRADLEAAVEAPRVYLEADARIGRGGCMIETEAGRVDARLEIQLENLKRALMS